MTKLPHLALLTILSWAPLVLRAADPSPSPETHPVTREIVVEKKLLHFPVKKGAIKCRVEISLDGQTVRGIETIELAEGEPDWWVPLDVSAWIGKKLSLTASLPPGSKALDTLKQSDTLIGSENLYREALRPQIHFSAKRGWLNDPNGLVFHAGEYHLFFQHNPYGWSNGAAHWGHAVSSDLVHWKELGEALYPDEIDRFSGVYSGSGVVDWKNTSGLGRDGKPPLVLAYTQTGPHRGQYMASSTDGRTFTKYPGNPLIKSSADPGQDPKVCWHEPSKRWVMVLHSASEVPGGGLDSRGRPLRQYKINFYTSPNLRDWTFASTINGGIGDDRYFHECPDFFELPVDGDSSRKKWILTAADSDYGIGTFDGTTFTPETSRLHGVSGVAKMRAFYAAQTFSDIPDGRRIQIGWCRAGSPGMPFNQCMSLPSELTLRTTPEGPRLARQPVKELASLRDGPDRSGDLANFRGEAIEIRSTFEPGKAGRLELALRGATIAYDGGTQELTVNGLTIPAPLVDGKQRLIAYVDRTTLEVYASDGLVYVPLEFRPKEGDQSVSVNVTGVNPGSNSLQVYKLKSIW